MGMVSLAIPNSCNIANTIITLLPTPKLPTLPPLPNSLSIKMVENQVAILLWHQHGLNNAPKKVPTKKKRPSHIMAAGSCWTVSPFLPNKLPRCTMSNGNGTNIKQWHEKHLPLAAPLYFVRTSSCPPPSLPPSASLFLFFTCLPALVWTWLPQDVDSFLMGIFQAWRVSIQSPSSCWSSLSDMSGP